VYLPNGFKLHKSVVKGGDVLPDSVTAATFLDQLLANDRKEIC
jgi:hypothetical protein